MADFCPRPQLTKIVLGIVFFFCGIVIICFGVGGPLYIQERNKVLSYTKDSCRIQSASYETVAKCIGPEPKAIRYEKCYVPAWHVELGQNGTLIETIRSDAVPSYKYIEAKSERYKVGSSYPCWYSTKKPSQVTWYGPTTFYSLILLIIGGISIPLAIVSLIAFFRLRERADL